MSKLTKNQEQDLISEYMSGKTTKELCIKYNYGLNNRNGVLNILKKYNIPIRKDNETHAIRYTIDDTFFDTINTEHKAYTLGLLYADGNVYKNTIRITLKSEDFYLLKHIKKSINYSGPLQFIKRKEKNYSDLYNLDINNKKLSKSLNRLGVVENKTHKLDYLYNIPDNLIHHFIRGYFDGDGSVWLTKPKKQTHTPQIRFSIVGNYNFIDKIQNIICNNCNLNKTKLMQRHKNRNNNIVHFTYGGKNVSKSFFDWLYKDATIFMIRKYNIFNGVFNQ